MQQLLDLQNKQSGVTVFDRYVTSFYRNDIQGLRAISALLILIYHIWWDRVSGGVDVFFVISGFLVTTSLLRNLALTGRIDSFRFWGKIWRRILPSAFLVLIATLFLTLMFVPAPLWKFGINEFVASAAHIENLELMRSGADYLDREAPPSQFQQFWALSIQMQFYLVLLLIFLATVKMCFRINRLVPLLVAIILVAGLSFAFSVVYTQIDPQSSYFHPFTRVWEFLVGVILALVYPFLNQVHGAFNKAVWNILSIVALSGIVFTGMVLPDEANFPGVVALLPVACAAIIVVAGKISSGNNLACRGLSNPILNYLGSFSFTIYLWHWPILIFAQHALGTTQLGFLEGLTVILVSVVLASVTKHFVETPWMSKREVTKNHFAVFMRQIGFMFTIVIVGLLIRQGLIMFADSELPVSGDGHQIDMVYAQSHVNVPLGYQVTVDYDRPHGIGCLSDVCVGGDVSRDYTVVMVGDSHAAQWFDVLDRFGKAQGFKVITKFGEDIVTAIEDTEANVLLTVSTRTSEDTTASHEHVRSMMEEAVSYAHDGLAIVGIRDNPRFDYYQNGCVTSNPQQATNCAVDRSEALSDVNPAYPLANANENVFSVDLSHLFCDESLCPAITDNIFIYYDRHHVSASYLGAISEAASAEFVRQAPGVFRSD